MTAGLPAESFGMQVRRPRAAVAALASLLVVAAPLCAQAPTKQLVRVSGTVQYQSDEAAAYTALFGRVELRDHAVAVTRDDGNAVLRLPDSSEVEIGARSRVRVGAFSTVAPNVLAVQLGAVHFVVRHPAGARSEYRFLTPTSQIAVRGTEGYLVVGPRGTDFYCKTCDDADVTVTVAGHDYPLRTGQEIVATGPDATPSVAVQTHPCTNPAAIAISHGELGRGIPAAAQLDPTGSAAGDPLVPIAITGYPLPK